MSSDGVARIGVVGLGYWGPNVARNVAANPRAELAWLCDRSPDTLAAAADRHPHARTTASYQELLEDPELDAVAIVTPVSTHYELAVAALEAGKHLLVEKPLAASSSQAADLIELASERSLVLLPGHTFLYSPPVVKVKELLDAGALGDIYFISLSRVNLGLHQPDVSVVWDLAPHDLSILSFWLGGMPDEVSAVSRSCVLPATPDVAFVNLRFGAGTIAHLELSWLSPVKLRRTSIVGSEKMVVYDDTSNEPIRIFDAGAELPAPETFGEFRLTYRTGDIVSPKIDAMEPLALEVDDFCTAILEGTETRSSPRLGYEVVRTVEAIERSLQSSGGPCATAEDADDDASLTDALSVRPRAE
ncbi:MAG TPA: Gfo/Idh/MocA family oxidoreductase [Gaiellaceae bacterium]|nr:Gfo/Idh/MocA family oxidoreductase [Gaiellaceae bacterium]